MFKSQHPHRNVRYSLLFYGTVVLGKRKALSRNFAVEPTLSITAVFLVSESFGRTNLRKIINRRLLLVVWELFGFLFVLPKMWEQQDDRRKKLHKWYISYKRIVRLNIFSSKIKQKLLMRNIILRLFWLLTMSVKGFFIVNEVGQRFSIVKEVG